MGTDDPPSERLLSVYRRYVGEPDRETDVYLGFALFFGGITLGVVGLAVFLWSAAVPPDAPFFWQLREVAIAFAFVGLPAFVLSVVVLLPVGRRTVAAGVAGAAVCLVAVGVFIAVYPENWNVQRGVDYSAQGIAVYAGGLALLVASTGTALVAHHLERARPAPGGSGGGEAETATAATGAPAAGSAGDDVSDERVRRDIEEAMSSAELSWGGVRKTETRRLTVDTGDVGDVDRSGFDAAAVQTDRGGGVDDAVAGLRKLQGGQLEAGVGEGTDDQTAALQELRERKRAEEEATPDSVIGRLRDRLGME